MGGSRGSLQPRPRTVRTAVEAVSLGAKDTGSVLLAASSLSRLQAEALCGNGQPMSRGLLQAEARLPSEQGPRRQCTAPSSLHMRQPPDRLEASVRVEHILHLQVSAASFAQPRPRRVVSPSNGPVVRIINEMAPVRLGQPHHERALGGLRPGRLRALVHHRALHQAAHERGRRRVAQDRRLADQRLRLIPELLIKGHGTLDGQPRKTTPVESWAPTCVLEDVLAIQNDARLADSVFLVQLVSSLTAHDLLRALGLEETARLLSMNEA
eukprot:CAMPEP_0198553398 /NCGR_PEP_ID=MMETSP1462-20131121/80476_1 /TAXON_ID=1333877 /ORGANISM="Brandtodinium nutriculum, Strain RCC3387" /LENGTH=267 /DNA_ID=CAMNT_0044284075 /DNA_START=49 /DNA_END=850 /DNA_ORIENTATION=-